MDPSHPHFETATALRQSFDDLIGQLQAARDVIDTPELYPTTATWPRATVTCWALSTAPSSGRSTTRCIPGSGAPSTR